MICDRSIRLTKSELAFLRRGPGFMMRQTVNEKEFCTELGKMVVKEKYDEADRNIADDSQISNRNNDDSQTSTSNILDEAERRITAEWGMTYDKESGFIDMGKFRATNYKFNKFVHLPEASSIGMEARHEVRKAEMLRIFREVCSDQENRGIRKNRNKSRILFKEKKQMSHRPKGIQREVKCAHW